jgi:hypothetical protein
MADILKRSDLIIRLLTRLLSNSISIRRWVGCKTARCLQIHVGLSCLIKVFYDAEATKRFEEWLKQNEAKIEAKKSGLEKSQDDELGKKLKEEKRINEVRAAKLAKKTADLAAKAAAGDKALVAEIFEEETAPAEESVKEPVAEETASEPVAEDKPQE